MREFSIDDINPIEGIKRRIWDIFNVLRGEISVEDYEIILLIITYYREDILIEDVFSEKLDSREFDNLVFNLLQSKEKNSKFIEIHEELTPILKGMSPEGFRKILTIVRSLNKQVLDKYFLEIFDDILSTIIESKGVRSAEHIQPYELTRFITGISSEKETDHIFNPFAGLASYGVLFENGSKYYGQELRKRTWVIGALRVIASRRPGESKFYCDNSIVNWPQSKFDIIVSTPPFRAPITNNLYDLPPFIKTAEQFLLFKGVESLNPKGRMIVVLPQGFLSNGSGDKKIREILIESGNLETVISLPLGIFQGTGIKTCILIIDKAKSSDRLVRFINAESLYNNSSKKKTLDDYKLGGIYSNANQSKYSWFVDIDQIRKNDYNLIGDRYQFENIDGVRLEEIIKPFVGFRAQEGENGRIVRIRDLSNDPIDSVLDLSKVVEDIISRPGFKRIDSSCLLLATRWKSLKPTYFQYNGTPIFISNDIEAFYIDSSNVNTTYLINELNADYVKEQLIGYSASASIPYIRKADLLKIIVKLPSLDEQEGKVKGLAELSEKFKTLEKERNALAHGRALSQFDEFASLKHTLGRPRQNILDWADNLLDFLLKNSVDIKSINSEFKGFYGLDITEALKEIKKDVGYMTEILERGEKGLILEDYPLSLVSLKQLNQFITGQNNNGFKFSLKKEILKDADLSGRGIDCNMTLLKVLLDNILTNADKYGFKEKSDSNRVMIELIEQGEKLIFRIRNNGKPFPKNFSQEKFVAKFSTAHPEKGTGLGGYDINRIATYFGNPSWMLHIDDKEIYPVEFEFMFKIKLIG